MSDVYDAFDQMKFLMIANHAPSLVGFRKDLICALQAKGFVLHVVGPGLASGSAIRKNLEANGVLVHNLPMKRTGQNPLADLFALFALWLLMRRVRPQYVLGYTIKPVIYGSIAAMLAGIKNRIAMIEGLGFVFTPNGSQLSAKRQLLKFLVQGMYRIGLSAATKIFFLNPDDLHEFVQLRLVEQRKTFMLGGIGVDLVQWPFSVAVTDPVTFLFVARLLREKGIEEFADAAKRVKQLHPKVRFVVLGGLDDNPGAIRAERMNRWVEEGILEWYGHVSVEPWMRQASVFVLPSYREGVPASTQEAMAMGRAIITTDVPGCRETVVDGENGFLVPVRDVDSLVISMMKFVENPQLIARMGLRSRQMAELKYDVHKVNALMMREMGIFG